VLLVGSVAPNKTEFVLTAHAFSYPLDRITISVVIPTYNEAANLPAVFQHLLPEYELIVVDGNSIDGTVDVARSLRPDALIVQQTRRGKGNAMACGFAVASGDVIVMLDADGSADPREIPRFVRVLCEGADFAKGTRFAVGGGSTDITPLRRVGNRALNGLVNVSNGTRYSDLCYGYNAFWRHCLPAIGLSPGLPGEPRWGDGFEVETLINVRVARAGLRVVEVPSFEGGRGYGESKLHAARDGVRVLSTIIREHHATRRIRPAPNRVLAPVTLKALSAAQGPQQPAIPQQFTPSVEMNSNRADDTFRAAS
jgi:glycosyltransferase involved in cell wall biosynthesis